MARQYIVKQQFITRKINSDAKLPKDKYLFGNVVPCGTYSEEQFKNIFGEDLENNADFKRFVKENHWIDIVEYKDISDKVINKLNTPKKGK